MKKIFALIIIALIISVVANAEIRLQDNFEYLATRTGTGANAFVTTGPWNGVKSINSTAGSGCGYIYTVTSIPGFTGSFPGKNSSRVACFEFLPYTNNCYVGSGNCPNSPGRWLQTDAYLLYGSESHPIGKLPANVWIQFWVYLQDYGVQQSRFYRGKWLYSCSAAAPTCTRGYLDWLGTFSESSSASYLETTFEPNTYFRVDTAGAANYTGSGADWRGDLLGHNQVAQGLLFVPNRWYLVKINFDTSNGSSGMWRMWKRTQSESAFTKVAEWIGGTTPNFTYTPNNTSGQRWLKLHTTIDCYDSFWYYDDFVIATSEADLPTYSGQEGQPRPPSGLHIQ